MNVRPFLIIEGEKLPVRGITYNEDGTISSLQAIRDFEVVSYANAGSGLEEYYEIVDLSECYVEENNQAIEKLEALLKDVKNDLNEISHACIPSPGDEVDIKEIREMWDIYNLLTLFCAGVETSLDMLKSE